jgi:hypothetical protein
VFFSFNERIGSMAISWDEARIAALSDADLVQLRDNALRKGIADVATLCNEDIERRSIGAKLKRARAAPVMDEALRAMQRDVSVELGAFAATLATTFDLSAERAQALSQKTLRFVPHKLTQANGNAKLGGLQRAGKCKIDRYISYRVKDTVLSLNMFLAKDAPDSGVTYQVFGPARLLPDGQPLKALRPGLEDETESKLFQWGQQFAGLKDAKVAFESLVASTAARRPSL